jgi:hypothetical protein
MSETDHGKKIKELCTENRARTCIRQWRPASREALRIRKVLLESKWIAFDCECVWRCSDDVGDYLIGFELDSSLLGTVVPLSIMFKKIGKKEHRFIL